MMAIGTAQEIIGLWVARNNGISRS